MRAAVVFVALGAARAAEPTDWWAFRPVVNPEAPATGAAGSASGPAVSPIDAFIAAGLDEIGLSMSPAAEPRELVRRAFFDLTGLPPTAAEVEAFAADPSDVAWAAMIDGLLSRPQYGERWARHWLDVVRFAETNGYERDGAKPEAWRYRDYVIAAFNDDKPYDRFVLEQVAGDELPGFSAEAIVATGFYRLHVWDDEPDSTVEAEFDDLDDIMVAASGAFLGLTMGCARCHDHKFDPITQREYYEMLAFFRSINPHGLHHSGGGGRGTGEITRILAPPDEIATWEKARGREIAAHEARRDTLPEDAPERALIEEALRALREAKHPFPAALAVTEGVMKPTHILLRGRPEAQADEVSPAIPAVLGGWRPDPDEMKAGGRRMALARWIADSDNPLTARVMANRIWQHHFGRGIVASPNDFGRTGEPPTHPELLDHLATRLIEGGWSVKTLHREIMLSRAYRMGSRADRPEALARDEGNARLWRQNPRRLEGEAIRDSILAFSGALNPKMGGPGIYPDLPRSVHGTQDSTGKGWGESPPGERDRRSIYLFAKRALTLPLLEVFDVGNAAFPVPRRPVTTVAPQALMLLNDDFVQVQAARLARRLADEAGADPARQIDACFRIVLQRDPRDGERTLALAMLDDQRRLAAEARAADPERSALTRFCVAMFNLNETIHVD